MSIPSQTILQTLGKPMNGIARGAALFGAQQARRYGPNGGTRAQQEFFAAVANLPVPKSEIYQHPGRGALTMRTPGELTPAELAWLDRLPRSPAEVTFEQAQRLAAMSRSFEGSINHADSKALVESIWQPVVAIHDRNAAEVELRNARVPLPDMPSAGTALADAIAAEYPDLLPHEVVARASAALDEATAARARTHNQRIHEAETRLADLNERTAQREAVTR